MAKYEYDLFVIGAGSGGIRAARSAAKEGARVGIAESNRLGGTCVNRGCVPKKLYVYSSHYQDDFKDSQAYGWSFKQPHFDWEKLQKNKDQELQRLNEVYASLLEESGVDIFYAQACLIDDHTIELEEIERPVFSQDLPQRVHSQKILIATGSRPFVPDFPGRQYVSDSNHVFSQEKLPQRALVVGGGYIALEFASIFTGMGVKTELVYRGELFLVRFDSGIRKFLQKEMQKKNLKLRFQSQVEKIEKEKDASLRVFLDTGEELCTDQVLYATGRIANTKNSGLKDIGVALDQKGNVKVDSNFCTNIPSIYALGDAIGRVQLTPVALAEAAHFVRSQIRGEKLGNMSYEHIPTAVFSQPSIGSVGLSEEEAREKYKDLRVYESEFRTLKHSLSKNTEASFIKLVVRKDDDRVLGAHLVGPEAGEIIQGLAIALKAGATKEDFDSCIAVHPTMAEEFVSLR